MYCDEPRIGLGAMLMLDGRVIAYASWQLKIHEKNYGIYTALSIRNSSCIEDLEALSIRHSMKANVVANALSRKAESTSSLTNLPVVERPLAIDVQALANQFVRLDVLELIWVLAFVVARSSLLDCIKAHQFDDPHVLVLKDTVQRGSAKEVMIDHDGVIRLQIQICVPNVDELRELILKETYGSHYSIHQVYRRCTMT
ncbi:uncharacterized protein [Nicotiana sylvestris]|uniref:uncharacterized protein n=1 Tax=Nicotiana sylvestris TaxID=4096 RepID=UPI00388C79A1